MAETVPPSIARVRLFDLIAVEGLPSESYKASISNLTQSFAQYSAAIIQLSSADGALLRSGLESARLFFHHRSYSPSEMVHTSDSREWCKTSGYYADPQFWLETFDYRPGFTPAESNGTMELPPAGLPDIFGLLGKVARHILDAISFSLNLRSISFTEILDNVPLRGRETSSSVLSVCCHSRPSFQSAQDNALTGSEDGQMVIFPEHEHQVEKSLITLVKSDRAGLHIKDFNGRWVLVDGDLGPQEGKYEGDWVDAKYDGYGVETWTKGSRYKGQYMKGLRHGFGVYRYYTGDVYAGEWLNGQSHGYGVHTCEDGSRYIGEFKWGIKHGLGQYRFRNGDTYAGEYFADKMHGFGVYHYANQQSYEGAWHEGRRHGLGMYSFTNGESQSGHWTNGVLDTSSTRNPFPGTSFAVNHSRVLNVVQEARTAAGKAYHVPRVDERVNKAVTAANNAANAARIAASKAVQTEKRSHRAGHDFPIPIV